MGIKEHASGQPLCPPVDLLQSSYSGTQFLLPSGLRNSPHHLAETLADKLVLFPCFNHSLCYLCLNPWVLFSCVWETTFLTSSIKFLSMCEYLYSHRYTMGEVMVFTLCLSQDAGGLSSCWVNIIGVTHRKRQPGTLSVPGPAFQIGFVFIDIHRAVEKCLVCYFYSLPMTCLLCSNQVWSHKPLFPNSSEAPCGKLPELFVTSKI